MAEPHCTTFAGAAGSLAGALAALTDLGYEIGPATDAATTVLDTFDGRLRRAGLRLVASDGARCDLRLSGDGIVAAFLTAATAPRFAHELPAGPFRSRIAAITDVRALLPQATIVATVRQAVLRDDAGRAVATVLLHEGLAVAGHDASDLSPVTVEVHGTLGSERATRKAVAAMERLGFERLDGDTIATLVALVGIDLRGVDDSPTVPLERDMPAAEGFAAVLANLARAIDANRPGTLDDIDPEFLHDLRVAVRRTRAVLAESKSVLPPALVAEGRERFSWLADQTGPARDLDVYLIEWDGYTQTFGADATAALAPVRRILEQRRAAAHAALETSLQSAEAVELLATWPARLAGVGEHALPGDKAQRALGRVVAKRIDKASSTLLREGRLIAPGSPEEQLHDLRKDAKKLRYLLECFGSILPAAPRKQFVKRLKSLQDNLGTHQDAAIHVALIREIAREVHEQGAPAETLLAIGQLSERLDQIRLDARAEFATRFAAYDTTETARSLDAVLAGLRR